MAYTYNAGDPVTVLLTTEPNGAIEPVSILDDAVKQIKSYLRDSVAGPKAILDALTTTVTANNTTALANNTARIADVTATNARVTTLETANEKKVIVTHVNAQAVIAGAGIAILTFDTEEVDPSGSFNPATFLFTAPVTGLYLVIAHVAVDTSASAAPTGIIHQLDIFVDASSGAFFRIEAGTSTVGQSLILSRMFNLAANQTISAKYTLTVTGGTMTIAVSTDPRETIFQACRLAS